MLRNGFDKSLTRQNKLRTMPYCWLQVLYMYSTISLLIFFWVECQYPCINFFSVLGGVKRPHFSAELCAKLRVAVRNRMDHLLTKFQKYRTENFGAINVLVTSLLAISDPKVAIVCESIKGKLLNGNTYKTQERGKMTSSTRWLSRIFDILWFWPLNFQEHLFCF